MRFAERGMSIRHIVSLRDPPLSFGPANSIIHTYLHHSSLQPALKTICMTTRFMSSTQSALPSFTLTACTAYPLPPDHGLVSARGMIPLGFSTGKLHAHLQADCVHCIKVGATDANIRNACSVFSVRLSERGSDNAQHVSR